MTPRDEILILGFIIGMFSFVVALPLTPKVKVYYLSVNPLTIGYFFVENLH